MQKEEIYRLIKNPGLLNRETLSPLKLLVEEFPYFQTGWVLYLKNLKAVNDPEYKPVLKHVAVRVSNRKKLYKWLNRDDHQSVFSSFDNTNSGNPSFQLEGKGEDIKVNPLIDRFLSSNSVMQPRVKTEKELAPDEGEDEILKKSVSENDDIVTETLAMIYFEQKKYDKALESFRKLSLKYPEKSVYFASRIEEIEKLKNI